MNPLDKLKQDVAAAGCSARTWHEDGEAPACLEAVHRFCIKYEPVTVRSLGGSLEIGRPNNVPGGHDYWVSEQGADAVPALMLKRKQEPTLLEAAKALLVACERGYSIANEMDTLRKAIKELEV